MGKNKLQRFEEMAAFQRVIQPPFKEIFSQDHQFKGQWKKMVFNNNNPIVLELGCGKGEYTVGLAKMFQHKNFIGVDIKGARIWRGAKIINEENINNAAFLRTRIEFIFRFFDKNEVDEIWLTFPDPQLKLKKRKKRLCSSEFLSLYQNFLNDNGFIHLKTDSQQLFHYAEAIVQKNNLEISFSTKNLYHSDKQDDILRIQTFYERQFLNEGKPIYYLQFKLPSDKILIEPEINKFEKV